MGSKIIPGSNPPPDEIGHVWYGQAVQQSWQSAHGNWEASCPVDCLIFKTQLLKRLQCVTVVNGATHTQEDVVQGNGSSLKNEAQISVLFFVVCNWFWGLASWGPVSHNPWPCWRGECHVIMLMFARVFSAVWGRWFCCWKAVLLTWHPSSNYLVCICVLWCEIAQSAGAR